MITGPLLPLSLSPSLSLPLSLSLSLPLSRSLSNPPPPPSLPPFPSLPPAVPLSAHVAGHALVGVAGRAGLLRVLAVGLPALLDRRRGPCLNPAGHLGLQLLHPGPVGGLGRPVPAHRRPGPA
jgi:hypothetical protein